MDQTLRHRAETVLQERCNRASQTEANAAPTTTQVLEDLYLHQIELEMRNEDLRRSQDALQAAKERFFNSTTWRRWVIARSVMPDAS
jgi:hypothetical protein